MSTFFVGFGREDYTPDKQVKLNSVKLSNGIASPLKVTCTALSDGEKTVLIFSNDLRGATGWFTEQVKTRVGEALNIPGEQIFVCATHNHSAPDINFYREEVMADWLERICFPATLTAAKNAVADLSPCTLKMGKTEVPKVAYTRRYFREDGAFHGIHVIKTSDAPIARHETEADPELRVLRFVREGKKDVVIVNFQVHAATGLTASNDLCADFITALRDEVEAAEDVQVMYLQGGCGNSNTFSKLDPDAPGKDFLLAGHRLAEGVLRIIGDLQPIESGEIRLGSGRVEGVVNHARTHMAPLAKQIFAQIEKEGITSEQEKRELFQANGFNSRYEASAILRRSKMDQTQSVKLTTLAFGDASFTFSGGEYFDVLFRRLRAASPYKMTMTVGYANGGLCYMPDAFGFANGGYEPLQCNFIPGTSETFCLELLRQLNDLKNRSI
ncbi:MAG: hypothetical protein IJC26_02955 [Clostridia bacterium]|nr:hypothetical protein [Clostridia bacterium]